MTAFWIALTAFLAAGLTFFSGFGLGTLLMPVFALFFPLPAAIAATAVVHLLNNCFKFALVHRHIHWPTVARFGAPAMLAAFGGAGLLGWLEGHWSISYTLGPWVLQTSALKIVIGLLIVGFSLLELWPRFQTWSVPSRWMPAGGLISGFFGGLSGHQGAFRSAFLIRSGLEKEAFIATGVMVAVLVDVARLLTYGLALECLPVPGLIALAVGAAFAGSWLGARLLTKTTLATLQRVVGILLALLGIALALGLA